MCNIELRIPDDSRAEATFQYTVQNISKLKETALSPPHIVRNLPWHVILFLDCLH